MKPPTKLVRVVNRKRYSVETATLIAGDDWWDGNNHERGGRNMWLYRTPKGNFFTVTLSQWQGETNHLEPCSIECAMDLFEDSLPVHALSYEEAFPDVIIEDA